MRVGGGFRAVAGRLAIVVVISMVGLLAPVRVATAVGADCADPMVLDLDGSIGLGARVHLGSSDAGVTINWGGAGTASPVGTGGSAAAQVQTYAASPGDVTFTYASAGTHTVKVCGLAGAAALSLTPTSTPTPTVDDTSPVTDQVVTAVPGTWGPSGVALKYQWYRKSPSGKVKAIFGATIVQYKVRASDVGCRLRVKVTGSLAGYESVSKYSALTAKVAKAPFTVAPAPTVSGVVRVGMPLTAVPGTWDPTATFKYQWYRVTSTAKSTAIKKATKVSYTPTATDKGRLLKVQVKGYRSGYVTTTRYSEVTILVQPGMLGVTPKVTGRPLVDQELTANEGTWSPPRSTFGYQWYAKSSSGKVLKISGATGRAYRAEGRYAGYKLKVRVTGAATDYASVTKTSAYTSTIAKANFTNRPVPTIDGVVQVGQTLTVTEGDWQPAPSSFSYRWYRSGSAIAGATSNAYTLVGRDQGKTITVKVTARRTGYVTASKTSAAIAAGGVAMISASSDSHTCALTTGGGVKCWGYDALGAGPTTNATLSPLQVVGLTSGVLQVTTGDEHTCALMTDSTVRCWGASGQGKLGAGTATEFSFVPVVVQDLSEVTELSAGGGHTCALKRAGSVYCWGDNREGQLGNGSVTEGSAQPGLVAGLEANVVAIASGGSHSCALTAAGQVKCWGANYHGQLGDGTYIDSRLPVLVAGLPAEAVSITAGGPFTCVVTIGADVWCWGAGINGSLGEGASSDSAVPVQIRGLASDVALIDSGNGGTCIITTHGSVMCWGSGSSGELGNGTTVDSSALPLQVTGLASGVTQISVGANFACARTSAGIARCWGLNSYGQLGDGTRTSRSVPVRVVGFEG